MKIIAPLATALVVLALLFKPFFGGWEGFVECIRFYLTPDVFSLLKGEFVEDWWSELKLVVWLLLGAGAGLSLFFYLS